MATGQLLWKTGVKGKNISGFMDLFQLLFSPYVFLGLAIYGMTTLLWLYILSKADISYVYPIQSVVFVFVLVGSIFFFNETVSLNKWVGVFVICFGVYLVTLK